MKIIHKLHQNFSHLNAYHLLLVPNNFDSTLRMRKIYLILERNPLFKFQKLF